MVNVYWACTEKEGMRAKDPTSIMKKYYETHKTDNNSEFLRQNSCPAFNSAIKNVYGLHSLYDYTVDLVTKTDAVSKDYDQKFFDSHFIVRDYEERFFSFVQGYVFFSDEPLTMRAYLSPFLENNEVSKRTYSIPGQFDIGRWIREIEFNFYLKPEYDKFIIKEDDIYTYLDFMTDKKVKLKRFYLDHKISDIITDFKNARFNKVQNSSLQYFYDMFENTKIKKILLEEIKKNLI
jgi:hypothetical protein